MELIDREALIKTFEKLGLNPELIDLVKEQRAIIKCGLNSENVPFMDLRPKPTGKWIYHKADGYFLPTYECSECHFVTAYGRPRFCMECGAKMEQGADE